MTLVRPKLWHELVALGIPTGFVAVLHELYREAPYVVHANGVFSKPFNSVVGLVQGWVLGFKPNSEGRLRGARDIPDRRATCKSTAQESLPTIHKVCKSRTIRDFKTAFIAISDNLHK